MCGATVDWEGMLKRDVEREWCGEIEDYMCTVPLEWAKEVCRKMQRVEKDWMEAVDFMAQVKGRSRVQWLYRGAAEKTGYEKTFCVMIIPAL